MKRGLIIGENFQYEKGLIIDIIYPWLIEIGDDVIFSANVTVLAHDAGLKNQLGLIRVGSVKIGNRVFVGLGTIILPNVCIGDDVIIGAGSVVSKNVPSGSVVAGVPAKQICSMHDYLKKIVELSKNCPNYPIDLNPLKLSIAYKNRMKIELKETIGLKKAVNYYDFNSLEKYDT